MRETRKESIEVRLHHPDPLEITSGIWPLLAGKSLAKPNYTVGPRTLPHFSLHIVLEGKLYFKTENVDRTLHSGDLFCLFPDTLHQYGIAAPKKPLRLMWIAFNGIQAERLLRHVGISKENPVLEKASSESLISLYHHFFNAFLGDANCDALKICSKIYEFFHLLHVQSRQQTPSLPEEWVRKSVDFMDLQYAQGIRVQDVALSLGVDRSHLSKKFKEYMGIGPKEYLQQLRMRKGADMLAETTLSVTEIALSLGFPDLYAFTRAFTSFYGEAPLSYRRDKAKKNL